MRPAFPTITELGGSPDAVIILAHGTFAIRAHWTRPESQLVRGLQAQFGGLRVMFQPFDWFGFFKGHFNNTHTHRAAAARALILLVNELHGSFPDASVFVVAHSHAGNIALYAVAQPEVASVISGIVCLGTPFLRVEPRDIGADLPIMACTRGPVLLMRLLSVCYLTFCILGIPLAVLIFLDGNWLAGTLTAWLTIAAWFSLRSLVRLRNRLEIWVREKVTQFVLQKQIAIVGSITARVVPDVPLFCLRTRAADEALTALALSSSLVEGPIKLFSRTDVSPIAAILHGLGVSVVAGVLLSPVLPLLAWLLGFREFAAGLGGTLGYLYIIGITLGCAGILLFVAMYFIAPLYVAIRALFFGPSMAAFGSFDIVAEYLVSTVVQNEPVGWETSDHSKSVIKDYDFPRASELRHSRFYSDQEAILEIAVWLRARHDEDRAA
jgi:hypothetical protein